MIGGFLSKVGGVEVEHFSGIRRSFQSVTLSSPPKAVAHTTEGGWEPSINVYRSSMSAPTFQVGRDGPVKGPLGARFIDGGRLRLAQFMPIGEMALSLRHIGDPETNRIARVQVEIVGFRKLEPWLPDDPALVELLAALMSEIKRVADVPLHRGGDGTRSVARWVSNSGWFGHNEVPAGNDHTDPGALKYDVLFRKAQGSTPTPEEDDMTKARVLELEKAAIAFDAGGRVQGSGPGDLPDAENAVFYSVLRGIDRGRNEADTSAVTALKGKLSQIHTISAP